MCSSSWRWRGQHVLLFADDCSSWWGSLRAQTLLCAGRWVRPTQSKLSLTQYQALPGGFLRSNLVCFVTSCLDSCRRETLKTMSDFRLNLILGCYPHLISCQYCPWNSSSPLSLHFARSNKLSSFSLPLYCMSCIASVLCTFAGNHFSETWLKGFQVRSHKGLVQQCGYLLLLSVACLISFNIEFPFLLLFTFTVWGTWPYFPKPLFLTKDLPANCRIFFSPFPFLMNMLILCSVKLHPGPSALVFRVIPLTLCEVQYILSIFLQRDMYVRQCVANVVGHTRVPVQN